VRAFEMALTDPAMMRFAMKHYMGMDDKLTVSNELSDKRPMQRVEAAERAAELLKKLGMTTPPAK
jgi:hypothetical protein